jgi:ABC-2 type transport system permease protein
MRNVLAVAERELRTYFVSPLAYVITALFLFLAGLLFALILISDGSREASLRGMLSNVSVIFLFIMPIISMRLLAEEQRSGTVELLLTNPVQEWEVVLGKFLGALLLVLVMLLLTLVFAAFLFALFAGYLGVLLQAAAFLAIGLWASSLTQNQIVAAVVAFAVLLFMWLSESLGPRLGQPVGTIVSYVSVFGHNADFARGVVTTKDTVFFLTVVAAGLVLSTLSLQSRRFR